MDKTRLDLFDNVAELIPVIWNYDKLGTFLNWRENALNCGIINRREFDEMGDEMLNGCGGL
jgi:hypothetical protein